MKNLLPNKEFQLNEILFENRNKNYGAYVLRNEADRILTKAMLMGIGVFAMIAISPLIVNTFNSTDSVIPTEVIPPIILKNLDGKEKPIEIIRKTPSAQTPVNSLDSRIPTPTQDAEIEKVMPRQTDYKDAVAGTQDIIGDPPLNINATVPPIIQDVPPGVSDSSIPKTTDNTPRTTVDVPANFMGGIDNFRNKVVNQFDVSVMEGTGEVVKTTVIFIVEKDGTISEVKATGSNVDFNREAIKTIKAVKGKWVPAKLNGENVRSYFKFPISMQFE